MPLTKKEKEYGRLHGWIRKKGILIDTTSMDYDEFFVVDDCKEDYYKRCGMWCDKEGDDVGVYDDEDIIEHIEEYADLDFKEWKKRKEEVN